MVYGYPAIAAAVDRRVNIELDRTRPQIECKEWSVSVSTCSEHPMALAAKAMGLPGSVGLQVKADVPCKQGLGSSAAFCVALARQLIRNDISSESVETIAGRGEEVFHGTPSGVDLACANSGGVVIFDRGKSRTVSGESFDIAICLTSPKPATKEMVSRVANVWEENPNLVKSLGEVSMNVLDLSEANLGRKFSQAQHWLGKLGLATAEIEMAVAIALDAGSMGAKLTGAGGGGAVISIGRNAHVVDAWRAEGFDAFVVKAGVT